LGGVPIGNNNANDIDKATGTRTTNGEYPYFGPTQAREGSNTFAAATFDIKFVQKHAIKDEIMTSACKFFGPEEVIRSAKYSVNPDSYHRIFRNNQGKKK
jgi:hypothetical protein